MPPTTAHRPDLHPGRLGLSRHPRRAISSIAPDKVRVITPDVGGGFGMKAFFYPEYAMAACAARDARPAGEVDRRPQRELPLRQPWAATTSPPPRWRSTPTASILGMRVDAPRQHGRLLLAVCAVHPDCGGAQDAARRLRHPAVLCYASRACFTNTVPVDAYRGAGRPEAIYCVERLIEHAARELGLDADRDPPAQLHPAGRRCRTRRAAGEIYDFGEFATVMDAAMETADWTGFASAPRGGPRRGQAARHRHVLLHRSDHAATRPSTATIAVRATTARSRSRSAPRPTARATRPPTRRS